MSEHICLLVHSTFINDYYILYFDLVLLTCVRLITLKHCFWHIYLDYYWCLLLSTALLYSALWYNVHIWFIHYARIPIIAATSRNNFIFLRTTTAPQVHTSLQMSCSLQILLLRGTSRRYNPLKFNLICSIMRTICVYMNEQCVNIHRRRPPPAAYVCRDNNSGAQLRVTTKNRKYLKTNLNRLRQRIYSLNNYISANWLGKIRSTRWGWKISKMPRT